MDKLLKEIRDQASRDAIGEFLLDLSKRYKHLDFIDFFLQMHHATSNPIRQWSVAPRDHGDAPMPDMFMQVIRVPDVCTVAVRTNVNALVSTYVAVKFLYHADIIDFKIYQDELRKLGSME